MKFGLRLGCLCLLAAMAQSEKVWGAGPDAAFAMSADEFRKLPYDDQKSIVIKAFERRLALAENIHYAATLKGRNHEYHDGKIGKPLVELNGSRLRHWRLGKAFRMDTIRGGDMSAGSLPVESVASGFDPNTGVGTCAVHFNNTTRCFGRIEGSPDPITESNRYACWLDGEGTAEQEFFIRYVVDHQVDIAIEDSGQSETVRLIAPWKPSWSGEVIGARTYELEPSKGFLPVRGKAGWELRGQDGGMNWRNEEFFVEAEKIVGGVYMPTKYKELIRASTLGAGLVTVWQTEVSKLEAGNVTPRDLEVPLTEGMEIVNAIEGVAYVIGPNGERLKQRPLIGADQPTSADSASDHNNK